MDASLGNEGEFFFVDTRQGELLLLLSIRRVNDRYSIPLLTIVPTMH